MIQLFVINVDNSELINGEDRFTHVRDALRTLSKMDFDKLIISVFNSSYFSPLRISYKGLSLLHLKLELQPARSQLLSVFSIC